jgi:hypothetical protein
LLDKSALLAYIAPRIPSDSMVMRDRLAELAEIETFIAKRGPTRCPDRFAGPVTAALSMREEATRIASLRVEQPLTLTQLRELLRRSWRLGSRR